MTLALLTKFTTVQYSASEKKWDVTNWANLVYRLPEYKY